jgi:hypothetical protein
MNAAINFEIVDSDIVIEVLLEKVGEYFLKDLEPEFVSPTIEAHIANIIDEFNEGYYFFIEYPYVDKVYRDSYYNYYSSKHYTYQRDCIRIAIFEEKVEIDDFLNEDRHVHLNKKYLGYFILRPTVNAILGRSIISPNAFKQNDFNICKCKTDSIIYGVKLEVEGFPHSSQDGETIKCAETTIWTIMEYFGNKYANYRPTLPGSIHETLKNITFQRQLPSNGLTMNEISYALKECGFGTRVYSAESYKDEIHDIIDGYIESGIPVVLGLQSGEIGHVVVAIGKQKVTKINWNEVPISEYDRDGKTVQLYDSTSIETNYVIQDDNLLPYRIISLDEPGKHYDDADCKKYEIDSVVVPLYPKIYLEAVVAKKLAIEIVKDKTVGFDFEDNFVFRFFLTSSRSFKNHITKLNNLDKVIKNNILITKMPKFIWCGEFYDSNAFESMEKLAKGIIILDATEADKESIVALIFAGYPDRCISFNENKFVTLQYKFENYRYYNNLK